MTVRPVNRTPVIRPVFHDGASLPIVPRRAPPNQPTQSHESSAKQRPTVLTTADKPTAMLPIHRTDAKDTERQSTVGQRHHGPHSAKARKA